MVLYICTLPVCVFTIISHRMTVNADKAAVLLVNSSIFSYDEKTFPDNKETRELFSDVVYCSMVGNIPPEVCPSEYVKSHFDSAFSAMKLSLDDFSEIYTTNDNWDLDINLYFNLIQRPYYWIELGKNWCFNFTHAAVGYLANASLKDLFKSYNVVSALAKFATGIVLEQSEDTIKLLNSKNVNFTIWNRDFMLEKLSDFYVTKIANCFCFDIPKNVDLRSSVMLITNSASGHYRFIKQSYKLTGNYGATSIQTPRGQRDFRLLHFSFIDKLALDFFAEKNNFVLLKSHIAQRYTQEQLMHYYGDYINTFTDMPFEFLARYMQLQKLKIDKMIFYFSTSKDAVNNEITEKNIILGKQYIESWWCYLQLYMVLAFLNLHREGDYFDTIYALPHIAGQFNLLAESQGFNVQAKEFVSFKGLPPHSIFIVDETGFGNLFKDATAHKFNQPGIFFLNMLNSTTFFSETSLQWLTSLTIHKTPLNDQSEYPCHDEIVWFFSKNREFSSKLRNFTANKTLPRVGITINVYKTRISDTIQQFYSEEQRLFTSTLKEQVGQTEFLSILSDVREVAKKNELLEKKTKKMQNTIDALQSSTSWRMTRPLRYLGNLFKRE